MGELHPEDGIRGARSKFRGTAPEVLQAWTSRCSTACRPRPFPPRLTPWTRPEHLALKAAITERLDVHDLLGVLPHGAPEDEYDSEMEDFAALIADGTSVTPDVVATSGTSGSVTAVGRPRDKRSR